MGEISNFSEEGLQEKLELLRKQRETMLEQANRQMAQMDGAIGFLEQLLSGELDEPADEDATAEPIARRKRAPLPAKEAN